MREPDLDLVKSVNIYRAAETTKAQLQSMKGESCSVDAVKSDISRRAEGDSNFKCLKCGFSHRPRACPAYGKECRACGRLHHYAKQCHAKEASGKHNDKQGPRGQQYKYRYTSSNGSNNSPAVYSVETELPVKNVYIGVLAVQTPDDKTHGW